MRGCGVPIVIGWDLNTKAPAEPTLFVNDEKFTIKILFSTVLGLVDTTGDGMADQALVDTTGDGNVNYTSVVEQTQAPLGQVGIDTTGDGSVDTFVDMIAGDATAEYKARVTLLSTNTLQLTFPADARERLSVDAVMEAIESWGETRAQSQADAVPWSTEHDFEIVSAAVGSLTLTPTPLLTDSNGDGVADVQQTIWLMPEPLPPADTSTLTGVATSVVTVLTPWTPSNTFGEALSAANDTMTIDVKISITQHQPPTLWDRYGSYVMVGAACCCFMCL